MLRISLAQELANIAVQSAANPLAAITFGAASISQYTIMAALALARYAGSVSAIDKQKFALGGLVHGKSHAQGGETFAVGGRLAELEGGEAVINKKSTAMFGNTLSAMNQAGGGVSFSSPNLGGSKQLVDYNKLGAVIGRNTNAKINSGKALIAFKICFVILLTAPAATLWAAKNEIGKLKKAPITVPAHAIKSDSKTLGMILSKAS